MRGLKGRVALVTGASRGIGRAVALRLAQEGCPVGLVSRDAAALNVVAGDVRARGGEAHVAAGDVSREEDVQRCVDAVGQAFGRIEVLVGCAGTVSFGPIYKLDLATWERQLSVDLRGAFLTSRAVIPYMAARKWGRIVHVTAAYEQHPAPRTGSFSVAKAGVSQLVRTLAQEVGGMGILANAVSPAWIVTRAKEEPEDPAAWRAYLERNPLHRGGTPDEVASAVAFLASDDASYINGQVLVLDGGLA